MKAHTGSKDYIEGKKQAAQDLLVVLAYILHKRGWKRKTIIGLLDKVSSIFSVINTGFMSVDKMADSLDKDIDIQLIKNSSTRR